MRGPAARSPKLKLVDGTHRTTRHGRREEVEANARRSAEAFGRLKRPDDLEGAAADIWDQCIAPAWWLDASRMPTVMALCEIWKDFKKSPSDFPQWKHVQMRVYLRELGLTEERNRISSGPQEKEDDNFA